MMVAQVGAWNPVRLKQGSSKPMTRENKLALVIGFALIVFVGVLVSDHFSAARLNESADLTLNGNSSLSSQQSDQKLIDLQESEPASDNRARIGQPAVAPTQYLASDGPAKERPMPSEVQTIRLPDLQELAKNEPTLEADTTVNDRVRFVEVRANESLSSICGREYGDQLLASALAKYNGISDPNMIRRGWRLRLPDVSVLSGNSNRTAPPRLSASDPRYARYTVKPGESLSGIATRLLKSTERWRELYDLNRDVIPGEPSSVRAGVTIKVPVTGSG